MKKKMLYGLSYVIPFLFGTSVPLIFIAIKAITAPLSEPIFVETEYMEKQMFINDWRSKFVDSTSIKQNLILNQIIQVYPNILIDTVYFRDNEENVEAFKYYLDSGIHGLSRINKDSLGRIDMVEFYNTYDTDILKYFNTSHILLFAYEGDGTIVYNSLYNQIERCMANKCTTISQLRIAVDTESDSSSKPANNMVGSIRNE